MAKPPKRSDVDMLGRVAASMIGAKIAESTGKSGTFGAATGLFIKWAARRSPLGILALGSAWAGHKLYKRNQERKFDQAARLAKPVKVAGPEGAAIAPSKASAPKKAVHKRSA